MQPPFGTSRYEVQSNHYHGRMRGLQLERPPRWGILALVLLVLGNVALFTILGMRSAPADTYTPVVRAASPSAVVPAAPSAPGTPAETPAAPPVLAVYGDGYAAGNEVGGLGAAGWPALVAARTGAELALTAASQAGYASLGTSGQNYAAMLQSHPVPDAAVTVLFGSRNDSDEDPAILQQQVPLAIRTAMANAPGDVLVVIGPVWSDAAAPESVYAVRDTVRDAAAAAGAVFVDPLDEGWFASPEGLIAADGISPTDAGHAALAELITPVVATALAQAATP